MEMEYDRLEEIDELKALFKSLRIANTKAGLWAQELVQNCNIDSVALLEHEVLSGNLESVFGSMQCSLKASAVELDFIRRHFSRGSASLPSSSLLNAVASSPDQRDLIDEMVGRHFQGVLLIRQQDLAGEAKFYISYCGKEKTVAATYAVRWFRLGADRGHVAAQFNLGVCYDNGMGVTQDATEAVRWFRLAADQGYAAAQFNLGVCCNKGRGVTQDVTKAVQCFRLAAEQGLAAAQFNLGNCYDNGTGVTQDAAEAMRWYRLAAEQGHVDAECKMRVGRE